jgi:hypothetical protein
MKIIAIQLFNILSINLVDAMIVNRTMLENKAHRVLKLSAKCYKNKKHTHYFKKFKNYVKQFQSLLLQKQPCSNTMLEIDSRLM